MQEQAVNDLIKTFTTPPRKRPRDQLVRISEWRARLSDDDRQILDEVIAESVRVALFGFFSVVDGARVVDEDVDRFIISALENDGGKVALNEDSAIDLHGEFAPD